MIPGEHLDEPVISRSVGQAPQQILDMDMADPILGKGGSIFSEDEESEFYGDGAFDSEDLDMEGFEFRDDDAY
ncbi:hypothetical protein EVA_10828 [gut metagenome]|uniref:Uncharacterized protein n=1 Tax=gut metagenome TaxID=749906 RepID=J9CLV8_9ZZZZ